MNKLWIYIPCIILNGFATYLVFSITGILLSNILRVSSGEEFFSIITESIIYIVGVIIFALIGGYAPIGVLYVQERVGLKLRQELLLNWIEVRERAADKYNTADLMVRIGDDLKRTLDLIGTEINAWILNPIVSGLISLFVVTRIHWSIGLYCLLCSLINLVLVKYMMNHLRSLAKLMQQQKVNLVKSLANIMSGAKELKVFHLRDVLIESFEEASKVNKDHQFSYGKLYAVRISFLGLIDFLNVAGLIIYGLYLSRKGILSFDKIMIAIPLSDQICQMVYQVGNLWSYIEERFPSMKRVFEMIDCEREIYESNIRNNNLKDEDTVVEYKNVSFGYNENHSVLDNISLTIKKGEKVAIIGESGSGKSTILQLLLGMYKPDKGEILLHGYSIEDIGLRKWRQCISCVQQSSPLLNITIRDNIIIGANEKKLNDDEIENVCMTAGCLDFINELPEGLDHVVDENGENLSGGQRQRIAIARCLSRDSEILILDEATASLDSLSERQIEKALDNISQNYTTIVVSHKLAAITSYDRIFIIDQGQIVESGTHKQLLSKNGFYSEMWKANKML